MTPLHVTSLWPIVISEMLQVFLQIEQELSTDTEEFRYAQTASPLIVNAGENLTDSVNNKNNRIFLRMIIYYIYN